ncbi:helix-turn-helix domain protein [Paenibacillus phage Norbert]|uniref:Helix-turn-helix domain XRE family transcriptional regulator n=2 Tax=root TaxID=1 RepID=A0A2I7SDF8_9CAUD|nr:helix-turn-helix transcriptional regulator [Paenibacillus larvae]YP_009836651.1 transcriptional repressor [Paenibacillus phage Likha]QHZ54074.1 helix-turn-helix family protein [Paenibacillus phage phiERICV]QVV20032.1 helix-turn-helix domain protein [Paenibacillus phage Norbert]QVV20236.1 helix-turn-helix transcriptional regulator [Paenibacillus phage Riker]AUS03930.1 helix-turn-helix domain XRE family transcriptional regulator [Paenibacillus phage Likha]QHZ49989.1 helix-turn-helix family p
MEMKYKEVFKTRLREMRLKNGYSQEEFAKKVGLKRTNIANYESGRNTPPSQILGKIAEGFNTSTDYLLGKTDNPESLKVRDLDAISIDDLQNFKIEYRGVELTEDEKRQVIRLLRSVLELKKE